MSLPRSCWAKLARAGLHAQELKDVVKGTLRDPDEPAFGVERVLDPNVDCFIVKVSVLADTFDWGVLLGDACHNFRGTLDHLAWHLVKIGSKPTPAAPQRVIFPIVRDWADWSPSALGNWLPGIDPMHETMLRRYQPAIRASDAPKHPFAVLQEVSNKDKHQIVLPILFYSSFGKFDVHREGMRDLENPRISVTYPNEPLQIGTELCRVCFTRTGSDPDLKFTAENRLDPALPFGVGLGNFLNQVAELTANLLDEFEAIL